MARWDRAEWKPITANHNKGRRLSPTKGLILHITDGAFDAKTQKRTPPSLGGVWSTFSNPAHKASAHFCVDKTGATWQFVDTDDRAWSVDGDTIDAHWISIENIAVPGDALTQEQMEKCADLMIWLDETYGISLSPAYDKDDWGLAYHALFKRGHPGCPGRTVISQIADICTLARGVLV